MKKPNTLDFPVTVGDRCAYVKHFRKAGRGVVSNELFCIVPANGNARKVLMDLLGRHAFTCNFKEMKRYPYVTYIFAVPGAGKGMFSFDRPRVRDILKVDKHFKLGQTSLFDLVEDPSAIGNTGSTKPVSDRGLPKPKPEPATPPDSKMFDKALADDMPLPQPKQPLSLSEMRDNIDDMAKSLRIATAKPGIQHHGQYDNLAIVCVHRPDGVVIMVNGCVYNGFMSTFNDKDQKLLVTTIILRGENPPKATTAP